MKHSIIIKVPVQAGNYQPLLELFFDGSQPKKEGDNRVVVQHLELVKLYTDVAGSNKQKVILLPTIREVSYLKFISPTTATKRWKLESALPEWQKFSEIAPFLKLEIYLRCPLFGASIPEDKNNREQYLKLIFSFNKNSTQFVCHRLKSNFAGLQDYNFNLDQLLTMEGCYSYNDTPTVSSPPRLLQFPDFCKGRYPQGEHNWNIRFSTFDEEQKTYSIGAIYSCERNKYFNGWGKSEETAAKLWPFEIAPIGNYKHPQDKNRIDIKISAIKSMAGDPEDSFRWQLETYWDSYLSQEIGSFDPYGAWNNFIAQPHLSSLKLTKAGNPGSVVPIFGKLGNRQCWITKYQLIDNSPSASLCSFDDLEIIFDDWKPLLEWNKPELQATLNNFITHEGSPLIRHFRLSLEESSNIAEAITKIDANGYSSTNSNSIWPQLELRFLDLTKQLNEELQKVRVGSLDLHFTNPAPLPANVDIDNNALDNNGIKITFWGLHSIGGKIQKRSFTALIEAKLNFRLSAFAPGEQDATPQEKFIGAQQLQRSILVPISDTANIVPGNFWLCADENTTIDTNQQLSLRLERVPQASSNAKSSERSSINLIILDAAPFLLARVIAPINLAAAREIGNRSEDESWEIIENSEGFQLFLPPQAVGEEFIKYYEGPNNILNSVPNPDERLNYKFSPPALFHASRTQFQQSFSEVPWNLRRLLGYPGQPSPGIGVQALEFELLYGLTGLITTQGLKLAEVDSRLGNLPNRLSVTPRLRTDRRLAEDFMVTAYNDYRAAYSQQMVFLRTKVALLQLWHLLQTTNSLEITEGISYKFRPTRKVVHPTKNVVLPPYYSHPEGLRGGVDWGFESDNIYSEVIKSGSSSSAKIINPSFTALGGNGYQEVSFAKDKSTIYANTFLGRTFFYSLQRIGRISMLWHPAKHVIIYERSVVDSDQFPDKTPGKRWKKRPVVRKMREYVELIQKERTYPESSSSSETRGFVLGAKLPEQILVDSSWGQDIPNGWIVPLFNLTADPNIYRKPDIALKLNSIKEETQEHLWGRVVNPEILYFYTNTSSSTDANTNNWPPVPGIDYPIEDLPSVPVDEHPTIPNAPDTKLPDAPELHSGYEQFTLKIDTANQATNLLTDRAAKQATAVVIENVTMIRRALTKIDISDGADLNNQIRKAVDAGTIKINSINKRVVDFIDNLKTKTKEEIVQAQQNAERDVKLSVTEFHNAYKALAQSTALIINKFQKDQQKFWIEAWDKFIAQITSTIAKELSTVPNKEQIKILLFEVVRQIKSAETPLSRVIEYANNFYRLAAEIPVEVDRLSAKLLQQLNTLFAKPGYQEAVVRAIVEIEKTILQWKRRLEHKFAGIWQDDNLQNIIKALTNALLDASLKLNQIQAILTDFTNGIKAFIQVKKELVEEAVKKLTQQQAFIKFKEKIDTFVHQIETIANTDLPNNLQQFQKALVDKFNIIKTEINNQFNTLVNDIIHVQEIIDQLELAYGNLAKIDEICNKEVELANEKLKAIIDKLTPEQLTEDVRRAAQDLFGSSLSHIQQQFRPFEQQVNQLRQKLEEDFLLKNPDKLLKAGDKILRLVRAYGLAPITQTMQLNRDKLAYFFQKVEGDAIAELKNVVDFTPATLLVNRFNQEIDQLGLKSLGVRLPSFTIGEQFLSIIPKDLTQMPSLKDILPDFAGINLDKLLQDKFAIKIPSLDSDKVKITHGFDPATRKAWANCEINQEFDKLIDIFEIGGLSIKLNRPKFHASTKISAEAKGIERQVEAFIEGDWQLHIGDPMIFGLNSTRLTFDNSGRLNFKVDPKNVVIQPPLNFISDLVRTFKLKNDAGFLMEFVQGVGGLPVGIRARLQLDLPPLQAGAFSISNISLATNFELAVVDGEFQIAAGIGFSTQERPFNLSIMCLGGGGWFNIYALYNPFKNKLSGSLSVGIAAGASLPFDIGVASGQVSLMASLGVNVKFGSSGNTVKIILRIALSGEIVLLGIVSISVLIALSAEYENGQLTCRGILKASVKICWCFEVSVEKEITMTFGGNNNTFTALSSETFSLMVAPSETDDLIEKVVDEYLATFGD